MGVTQPLKRSGKLTLAKNYRNWSRLIPTEAMKVINQFDRVILTIDLPDSGLEKGDIGTVVDIYQDGEGYEVEFMTLQGKTVALETLLASQVRGAVAQEIPHAREWETA